MSVVNVYREGVKYMRMKPWGLIIGCIALLCSCATLDIPGGDPYPFRANFSVRGTLNNRPLDLDGAVALTSSERAVAQIYGPMGMVLYTVAVESDRLTLRDIWGRDMAVYQAPVRDLFGLIAGVPPAVPYLYAFRNKVHYVWGYLEMDEHHLPREVLVHGKPELRVSFRGTYPTIELMIHYGFDTLTLNVAPRQGGRWGMEMRDSAPKERGPS